MVEDWDGIDLGAPGGAPRTAKGNACRHKLLDVLSLALVTSICGAESCVDIADFGRDREGLFREFLELPSGIGYDHLAQPYRGFRISAEIIEHAVWLYHCFSLSLHDIETILAVRSVVVSYESIREWSLHFGRLFANALK